jgi:hypothetical protein
VFLSGVCFWHKAGVPPVALSNCLLLGVIRTSHAGRSADQKWSPSPPLGVAMQQRERSRHQFLRFFAELRVEVRMIESVDPALESSCVVGSVKELRRDAQSADLITGKPSSTNLVGLGLHAVHRRRECAKCR